MEFKSNIQDTIDKLESIKASLGGASGLPPIPDFSDAMLSAMNTGMGLMKQRIFTKGMDAEGIPLGRYVGNKSGVTKRKLSIESSDALTENRRKPSRKRLNKFVKDNPGVHLTEYEKFRASRGRQIEYKDLEVDGTLRRSIEIVKDSDGNVVIAITNNESSIIAHAQESQIARIRNGQGSAPVPIFILSAAEYEQVKAEGNILILQAIKNLVNQ